jgi:hypothetical protein
VQLIRRSPGRELPTLHSIGDRRSIESPQTAAPVTCRSRCGASGGGAVWGTPPRNSFLIQNSQSILHVRVNILLRKRRPCCSDGSSGTPSIPLRLRDMGGPSGSWPFSFSLNMPSSPFILVDLAHSIQLKCTQMNMTVVSIKIAC